MFRLPLLRPRNVAWALTLGVVAAFFYTSYLLISFAPCLRDLRAGISILHHDYQAARRQPADPSITNRPFQGAPSSSAEEYIKDYARLHNLVTFKQQTAQGAQRYGDGWVSRMVAELLGAPAPNAQLSPAAHRHHGRIRCTVRYRRTASTLPQPVGRQWPTVRPVGR